MVRGRGASFATSSAAVLPALVVLPDEQPAISSATAASRTAPVRVLPALPVLRVLRGPWALRGLPGVRGVRRGSMSRAYPCAPAGVPCVRVVPRTSYRPAAVAAELRNGGLRRAGAGSGCASAGSEGHGHRLHR